jgi:4-hydroxy-3-polyprenylbenzoate decarboxylase
MKLRRLIVGISGASGIIYGVRLLQLLQQTDIETHLIVSRAGEMTRAHELELSSEALRELADVHYPINDIGAALSSGSYRTMGMVIAPCSTRTLAEIATGVTSTLLTRAADVVLKERRRLVLLLREAPLTSVHIKNMQLATEAGAIIYPPVPAFYALPKSIDDIVTNTMSRVLDLFDVDTGQLKRWGDDLQLGNRKQP